MTSQIPIFDIDTHYSEPPDLWTSRAPSKYKDQVLHIEQHDGRDSWFVAGQEVATTGPAIVNKDMKKVHGCYTLPTFAQMGRAGSYVPERLAYMNDAGVGTQIVYPNVIGFGGQAMMRVTSDVELRLFHVQAYNDAILDLQKESGGRLRPQAALPLWDMDASLKELDRIRKMGLTGVAMSNAPGNFGQPTYGSSHWDRFFSVCQDLGLPINFHVASGNPEGDLSKWWGEDHTRKFNDGALNAPLSCYAGVQLPLANCSDICNLILTGILEKFPRLKFVSVESGCGWVPFIMNSLEHHWNELMTSRYLVNFKRGPKEMFMDQIYCSYWFESSTCVDAYLKEFGPDNLMFETDFPHPTSLYPNDFVDAKIKETLGHHDRATQEKILYKNAERVYGAEVYRPSEVH